MIELNVRIKKTHLYGALVVLALALFLVLVFTFASRTQWVVLYSNRGITETSQISTILDEANIRHRLSTEMNRVDVPARDRIEAHAVVLRNLSVANITLDGALNLSGLGTMEEERAHILIHQTQNDIEQMLILLDGIDDANVIIAPGSAFLRPDNLLPHSLGVILHITHEFPREYEDVFRIIEMLLTMIQSVEVENIIIVDQYMNPIFMREQ